MSDNEQKNEKRETLADIVAEKRELAKKMRFGNPSLDEIEMAVNLEYDANRIEALWKREKAEIEALALSAGGMVEASRHKPVGNAEAMRKALKHCIEELSPYCDGGKLRDDVLEEAKAALAAPARNCDRLFDSVTAIKSYQKETGMNKHHIELWTADQICAFIDWLLSPAAERKGECDAM